MYSVPFQKAAEPNTEGLMVLHGVLPKTDLVHPVKPCSQSGKRRTDYINQ